MLLSYESKKHVRNIRLIIYAVHVNGLDVEQLTSIAQRTMELKELTRGRKSSGPSIRDTSRMAALGQEQAEHTATTSNIAIIKFSFQVYFLYNL